MKYISEKTKNCITFVPRMKTEKIYVNIKNDASGCWADVGYDPKAPRNLNLANGCFKDVRNYI